MPSIGFRSNQRLELTATQDPFLGANAIVKATIVGLIDVLRETALQNWLLFVASSQRRGIQVAAGYPP